MGKLIGYVRVSTRAQDTDRQVADLLAVSVRRDDLYVDHGVSGAHAQRPQFDKALEALHEGDTLIVPTLDRLGRSTSNMLALADEVRTQHVNLGGGNVDTGTPMGSMVFTVMAALAQMELEIKHERIYRTVYATKAQARRDVIRYIEGFYNSRRHSALGYRRPNEVHYSYQRPAMSA